MYTRRRVSHLELLFNHYLLFLTPSILTLWQVKPLQAIAISSLSWWLESTRRAEYPRLSQMAIILAKAELVFSNAR